MQIRKDEFLQILYTYKNFGVTNIHITDDNFNFLSSENDTISADEHSSNQQYDTSNNDIITNHKHITNVEYINDNVLNNDNNIQTTQNTSMPILENKNDLNNFQTDKQESNDNRKVLTDNNNSNNNSNVSTQNIDNIYIDPKLTKQEQWQILRNHVLSSQDLLSHVRPGKKLVFGIGNLDAKIFFCGEAPGADEEIQGEPFVGRAGQLLTKMIAAIGLSREDVYIGNIMNWRPETVTESGNRPPTQDEMEYCLPFLKKQISIVKPQAIVALGATAVNGLLGIDNTRRMSQIRGSWFSFCNIPLMITFHPSYILRNNTNKMKRLVWEDLLSVMEKVHMPISEKQRNYFL